MALSKSLSKAQIPLGCQLCEIGSKIKWMCNDCSLLICDTCRKVHLKLAKDHRIVDAKSIKIPKECLLCGTETTVRWKCDDCNLFLCETCKCGHLKIPATKDHKIVVEEDKVEDGGRINPRFKLVRQYSVVNRNINHIAVSPDGSIWIGDYDAEKLVHVKLSGDIVTVLSTFDITPLDFAISPFGSLLVVDCGESSLTSINETTGKALVSMLTIHPWRLNCVGVTKDQNIVVGGEKGGKGVVIVMDQNGKHLITYEKNNSKSFFKLIKRPLFVDPRNIATTRNGNIFVSDDFEKLRGRVIVIKQAGEEIQYYKGHPNSYTYPFDPVSMLVTPKDNVIIMDNDSDFLHILNNEGDFLTYFNLADIGLNKPYSLALSPSGNIFIGSVRAKKDPDDSKGTLYELEFSGI